MPVYKSKTLILTAPKTGGKNKSPVDGFYTDSDGAEYFIKKPADQKELFTELFAGLLLQEFMSRNLINKHYHPSLICADVIQFEDGSYGLIQPKVAFTELYKKIDTAFRDGSDRAPWWEMIAGPNYYPTLTKQGNYFGLSTAIMFSLLLGDYSVHSGNVVCLAIVDSATQFARIDWGAAFRYYAHKENNTDILKPHEYDGRFNLKAYTKGYVKNYKNIPGLFPSVAKKANELLETIEDNTIFEIVSSALKKIPHDMLNQGIRAQIADYMCLDSFKNACCGDQNFDAVFARDFADILTARLSKITTIKEMAAENKSALYQSVVDGTTFNTPLSFNKETPFENLIGSWHETFSNTPCVLDVDVNMIDMNAFTDQFNQYLGNIVDRADTINFWDYDNSNPQNIIASFYEGNNDAKFGHAFVAQYRESTILRRLFSIDPDRMETARFFPYETLCHTCTDPRWLNLVTLLSTGSKIINLLTQIEKIKDMNQPLTSLQPLITSLKKQFILFNEYRLQLERDFVLIGNHANNQYFDSEYFYPIDNESLQNMTGDQLATICLEELDSAKPGPLVARIIQDQILRERLQSALSLEHFGMRHDKPAAKIHTLSEWCRHVVTLSAQLETYKTTHTFLEKKTLIEKIDTSLHALPACLQTTFTDVIKNTNAEFERLQRQYDCIASCQDKAKLIEEATTPEDKITAFSIYDKIFQDAQAHLDNTEIERHNRLEKNNRAWEAIVIKKINTGNHILDEAKLELINWLDSLKLFNQKAFNKIIKNEASLHCLMTNKYKNNTCQELLKAAFEDQILWTALTKTGNRQLSPLLIQDLLTLKKFADDKIHENKENKFGHEYSASVRGFYRKALHIRLSSIALPEQARQMTWHAHYYFDHRHQSARLLADALLCISILGLGLLIARKASGKTFFFSNEITNREHCFKNNCLSNLNVLKSDEEPASNTPQIP